MTQTQNCYRCYLEFSLFTVPKANPSLYKPSFFESVFESHIVMAQVSNIQCIHEALIESSSKSTLYFFSRPTLVLNQKKARSHRNHGNGQSTTRQVTWFVTYLMIGSFIELIVQQGQVFSGGDFRVYLLGNPVSFVCNSQKLSLKC